MAPRIPSRSVLCRGYSSGWNAAISSAQKLLDEDDDNSTPSTSRGTTTGTIDPFSLVGSEMSHLTDNIHALLGSTDVNLDQLAKYYVRNDGAKRIRPLMVLLMAQAVPRTTTTTTTTRASVNESLSPPDILNDANPSTNRRRVGSGENDNNKIDASQRRLAEITEMIHAASLLHDDVIDDSEMRRGQTSANFAFSPKMAVLAGDFMLGRASVALARLRDPQVIELLATVIANLVEGEFMQLKNTIDEGHASTMEYYLQKTYLKTASLISKSCRASAILGGGSEAHIEAAYQFGKNLGLAFQIVDDMLDYSASAAHLGKPSNADLKLGLATAPVLFAWRQHPELGALIKRKFAQEGDIDRARTLALNSDGLEKTRQLAETYCQAALAALARLPESPSRNALEGITHQVLTRTR